MFWGMRVFLRVLCVFVIGALKFTDWRYYAMAGLLGLLLRRRFLQVKVHMALPPYILAVTRMESPMASSFFFY